MITFSKKGQVNTLAPMMIALILAAVLLVFGLVMIQETRDTDIISQAQSSTVINESGITLNDTPQSVAKVGYLGANNFVAVSVNNGTDLIESGNYTFTSAGAISNLTATYGGETINITYTYSYGGQVWSSANDTIAGIGTFADFWEIIVLAIVISIVIGLLLVVFGGRKPR